MKVTLKLLQINNGKKCNPVFHMYAKANIDDKKTIIFPSFFFENHHFLMRMRVFTQQYPRWKNVITKSQYDALSYHSQQQLLRDYISSGTRYNLSCNFDYSKELFCIVLLSTANRSKIDPENCYFNYWYATPEAIILQEQRIGENEDMKIHLRPNSTFDWNEKSSEDNSSEKKSKYMLLCSNFFGEELTSLFPPDHIFTPISQENKLKINTFQAIYSKFDETISEMNINFLCMDFPKVTKLEQEETGDYNSDIFNHYYNFLLRLQSKKFIDPNTKSRRLYDYQGQLMNKEQIILFINSMFRYFHTHDMYGLSVLTLEDDDTYLGKDVRDMANIAIQHGKCGGLQIRIVPKGTKLYFMTKDCITKDDLNKNETIWSFLSEDDLDEETINHYRSDYQFEMLNVFIVEEDLLLVDMSHPDTVLRLFSDSRIDYQTRQQIAYCFRVAFQDDNKDNNKNNDNINKNKNNININGIDLSAINLKYKSNNSFTLTKKHMEVQRCSQGMMDDNLVNNMRKFFPDFEGFIYYLDETSKFHHNEMCVFRSSKLSISYSVRLDHLKSLTDFIWREDLQYHKMDIDMRRMISVTNFDVKRQYPRVIATLNEIYFSPQNKLHCYDINTILYYIFQGYFTYKPKLYINDELQNSSVIIGMRIKYTRFLNSDIELRYDYDNNIGKCTYSLTLCDFNNKEKICNYINNIFNQSDIVDEKFHSDENVSSISVEDRIILNPDVQINILSLRQISFLIATIIRTNNFEVIFC